MQVIVEVLQSYSKSIDWLLVFAYARRSYAPDRWFRDEPYRL